MDQKERVRNNEFEHKARPIPTRQRPSSPQRATQSVPRRTGSRGYSRSRSASNPHSRAPTRILQKAPLSNGTSNTARLRQDLVPNAKRRSHRCAPSNWELCALLSRSTAKRRKLWHPRCLNEICATTASACAATHHTQITIIKQNMHKQSPRDRVKENPREKIGTENSLHLFWIKNILKFWLFIKPPFRNAEIS